jgi:hypothetical protein
LEISVIVSKQQKSLRKNISYQGAGMAIGLTVGGVIGLALGNIVLAGGGMVLGLAIGSFIDKKKSE